MVLSKHPPKPSSECIRESTTKTVNDSNDRARRGSSNRTGEGLPHQVGEHHTTPLSVIQLTEQSNAVGSAD
uniref:Uncharacterized protein n=1 Tax=Timema shepardi TaxID=629360 RepID=A0A7R9AMM0_TIMSH|nr:unnamed protein product [Timema shepardi]